jgi:hypothetical protein
MIPVEVDVQAIVDDLNNLGWKNQKIEVACGFANGYILKLRDGPRPNRPYQMVARLFNFWEEEMARHTTFPSTHTGQRATTQAVKFSSAMPST